MSLEKSQSDCPPQTATKLLKTKTLLIDGPRLRKRLSNEDRKLEIELKGCKLGQVENVKLLGLELDEQLSFDVHINYLCKTI